MLTTLVPPESVDTLNHTLLGVKVKAKEVVCRNMWGTPMMPDGKGSYNLISPPDPVLIERSLVQPPKTDVPLSRFGNPDNIPSTGNPLGKKPESAEILSETGQAGSAPELATTAETSAVETPAAETPAAQAPAFETPVQQ